MILLSHLFIYLFIKWHTINIFSCVVYKCKVWIFSIPVYSLVKGLYLYDLASSFLFSFESFSKIFFYKVFVKNCWGEKNFYWITWLFIEIISAIWWIIICIVFFDQGRCPEGQTTQYQLLSFSGSSLPFPGFDKFHWVGQCFL